jgi:hypothetical protein
VGYLCACFGLSHTARRLLFALRGKYAQFGGPAVMRGKRSTGRREFDPVGFMSAIVAASTSTVVGG